MKTSTVLCLLGLLAEMTAIGALLPLVLSHYTMNCVFLGASFLSLFLGLALADGIGFGGLPLIGLHQKAKGSEQPVLWAILLDEPVQMGWYEQAEHSVAA